MKWNWQQSDWLAFSYDFRRLDPLEAEFLHDSAVIKGAFTHLEWGEKATLTVDLCLL